MTTPIRKCALTAVIAAALAPWASAQPIDQYEVLNDGYSPLAILCPAVVYRPNIAWCVLRFERKVHSSWRLVGPTQSHVLDRGGNPCAVTSIADAGHKTRHSGWFYFTFSSTTYTGGACMLGQGDPTHWAADDRGGNVVAIDAR